jgi:ABC-type nitrate/sulfonate/bicarbonate transport system substrate-binding protein
MIESLKSKEIDVGIGLTEGWVAGLAKSKSEGNALPYKIVGSYVRTPLCWAISTGTMRDISRVEQLRGGKIGVSRIGSGSYVMPFVLADQLGWLEEGKTPFEFVPLGTFEKLRAGVNDETADAFM